MAAKRSLKQDTPRKDEAPTTSEKTRDLLDKLHASEARYRRLFETAQDGILLLDAETGQITDVNPFLLDLLGYPYKEIVGKKLWEIGPFRDRAEARHAFAKLQTDHYARYENLPLEASDGRRVQVEFVSNLYAVGDTEVIQCNIRDIAQRRFAEDVARGRDLSKELALAAGELGVWRLDLATGKTWRSPRHDQIFGYPALLPEWTYEIFLSHVLAEDCDAVAESFGKALATKTDWDFTCRIRRKDGEVRWIWGKGEPELNERHAAVALIGLIQDITERKQAEASLADSELKYRQVVENAAEAIFVAQDGRIVFLNPATTAMFGRSREELLARPVGGFFHPDDRDMVLERHQAQTRAKEAPSVYSFRIIRGDGSTRWAEATAVHVDWQGKPASLNLLGDVTERRLAEEALNCSFEATLTALGHVAERRDPYTAGHQRRVTDLALAIARKLGYSSAQCNPLRIAGMLHDIGKVAVPAEILTKPGALTKVEVQLVRTHSQAGYEILADVAFPGPVAEIVFQHHERLDGSGYPEGISGDEILREAKILAVADVVEAMASHRPYRTALGIDAALEEIREQRGRLYDSDAVDACIQLFADGFEFAQVGAGPST